MYRSEPCKCGHESCKDWHISGVAAVQGVKFTEEQATGLATILNMQQSPTEIASMFFAMSGDYGDYYTKCRNCGIFTHTTYLCRGCGKEHSE